MYRRFPNMYGPSGWWYPVLHVIFWFAILAALVALGIWLVRRVERSPAPHTHREHPRPTDAALEHARVRYARGEITREQYLQIVADLGGTPPAIPSPPPPPAAPPGDVE